MRDYLHLHEVLAIHAMSIKKYGGTDGVRDVGAVQAAIFRPQSGYYNNIIEEAAALMESLLINHPFVDGNKRTAFAVCHVFLDINGYSLQADAAWIYDKIIAWIENKDNRFETIVADLGSCVVKI